MALLMMAMFTNTKGLPAFDMGITIIILVRPALPFHFKTACISIF